MKESPTVLLVDNHEAVVQVFKEIGERHGLKMIFAEDGQEGLDMAKEELPELVVIRRNCPTLDALSVSVLLKQSPDTSEIPIVVICSGATPQEKESFRDAGCNGCIEEPISMEELIVKLKEWLP